MDNRQNLLRVLTCYILWGFQPLYWALLPNVDAFTILGCRVILAALFSVFLCAVTHRLDTLRDTLRDKAVMRRLVPAAVFLLADWAVFLIAVGSGHVLDASLGYYINPLLLFAAGVIIYHENITPHRLLALGVAFVGVLVSTVAFGVFPTLPMLIAVNWAVYASIKKNVKLEGIVSIAVETLMMSPFAAAFLVLFKRPALAAFGVKEAFVMLGGGIITALPMFLYADSVSALPLVFMCFAQYLSPTFNLLCSLILKESFSRSQLISLAFFLAAIIIFSVGELMTQKRTDHNTTPKGRST